MNNLQRHQENTELHEIFEMATNYLAILTNHSDSTYPILDQIADNILNNHPEYSYLLTSLNLPDDLINY